MVRIRAAVQAQLHLNHEFVAGHQREIEAQRRLETVAQRRVSARSGHAWCLVLKAATLEAQTAGGA